MPALEWKGPVEGWSVGFIRSNLWRLQPHYDMDDMMNEALKMMYDINARYGPTATNERHLMSLYMTGVRNDVEYYAARARRWNREPNETLLAALDVAPNIERLAGDSESEDLQQLEFDLLLEEEPVLARLAELFDHTDGRRKPRVRQGETINDFLKRVLNRSVLDIDMIGYIRRCLEPNCAH